MYGLPFNARTLRTVGCPAFAARLVVAESIARVVAEVDHHTDSEIVTATVAAAGVANMWLGEAEAEETRIRITAVVEHQGIPEASEPSTKTEVSVKDKMADAVAVGKVMGRQVVSAAEKAAMHKMAAEEPEHTVVEEAAEDEEAREGR